MEPDQQHLEPLLSVGDVSEILGVTPKTIYRLVIDQELPVVRVGRKKLAFTRADVRKYIARKTTPAAAGEQ